MVPVFPPHRTRCFSGPRATWFAAALAFAILTALPAAFPTVFPTARAIAESGAIQTLPAGRPANGLTLDIDTRWVGGAGYHPVFVRLNTSPLLPSTRQRTFRIELKMYGAALEEPATVSQYFNIEQGQTGAGTTVLVPQSDIWSRLMVTVYEDGALLDEVSGTITIQAVPIQELSESKPSVVFVSSKAPTLSDRAQRLNTPPYRRRSPVGEAPVPSPTYRLVLVGWERQGRHRHAANRHQRPAVHIAAADGIAHVLARVHERGLGGDDVRRMDGVAAKQPGKR